MIKIILIILLMINSLVLYSDLPEDDIVLKYSTKYKIPYSLVISVIEIESRRKKNAESNKGSKSKPHAYGIMQILLNTGKWVSPKLIKTKEDLFDVEKNIQTGVKYLSILKSYYTKKKKTNWKYVIMAYNIGPGNLKQQKLMIEREEYFTLIKEWLYGEFGIKVEDL